MIWRLAKDLDLPEFWPYGHLKGPKIENEALKNNVLSSLHPMDENSRRHEQGYELSKTPLLYKLYSATSSYYLNDSLLFARSSDGPPFSSPRLFFKND